MHRQKNFESNLLQICLSLKERSHIDQRNYFKDKSRVLTSDFRRGIKAIAPCLAVKLFQSTMVNRGEGHLSAIKQNQSAYKYSEEIENNLLHKVERHFLRICYTMRTQPFRHIPETGNPRLLQGKYEWLTYYTVCFLDLCLIGALIEKLRIDIYNEEIATSSHTYRIMIIIVLLMPLSLRSVMYFKRLEFIVFSNTCKKFYQDLQGKACK